MAGNQPTHVSLKELQTRFLFPLFFRRRNAKNATEKLLALSLEARDGEPINVWGRAKPPQMYKDELLDHVIKFLFASSDTGGCEYLKLSGPAGNRWFNNVKVLMPPDSDLAVRLVSGPTVELFLSNYGVGVLSIALRPEHNSLRLEEAIEFNYRLSQLRADIQVELHIPHPSEDAHKWAGLRPEVREHISPAPDRAAPVCERLGKPGASFNLSELIREILFPLADLDLRPIQDRLSVYTVARLDEQVDFERQGARAAVAPVLSALAQVEEWTHAGSTSDGSGVSQDVLNRKHWAAVGLLGAAHVIADQAPFHHPFNSERMPRVFLKYFVPYLIALLQRLTLHRTMDEAAEIDLSRRDHSVDSLRRMRTDILGFALHGNFTHVSTRQALHRYYRISQDGLDIRNALVEARRAISDIDSTNTADQQVEMVKSLVQNEVATQELQQRMAKHLKILSDVQVRVEWIEIFVVSVYAAHLWDLFATHIDALHSYVHWGVLFWSVLSGGIATAFLRPWRHHNKDVQGEDGLTKP